MSTRVDFSSNATVYDRRHGSALSDEELARLWEAAGLEVGARVLDIGAGTGRVALPFANRGSQVIALEPARGMLDTLRAKTGDIRILAVAAEGARLPFPDRCFVVVVIARLLYLTADWPLVLNEAHRVLAGDGRLLHEWGNGETDEPWVQIREEARRLFQHAGVAVPFHPGVRSETDVDAHLESLGLVREPSVPLGPGRDMTLRAFLGQLVAGELSYIWDVPDRVREACLPRLQHWSEATFDLDQTNAIPRRIVWSVYRKDAA